MAFDWNRTSHFAARKEKAVFPSGSVAQPLILRPLFNPHYHAIILEGGFDEDGRFVHIPFGDVQRMSEYFRRMIIKFFLKKQLINASLATKLINWRHSGFSVDNAVGMPVFSDKARRSLSQYIARPPLSLKKISIQENGEATVISYTPDNDFFKGRIETFPIIFSAGTNTAHPTARISIYPAIWAPGCSPALLRGAHFSASTTVRTVARAAVSGISS